MAKGSREVVGMVCTVCKSQNYATMRNKVNLALKNDKSPKLLLNKFCKTCKKVTSHKETTKLK